MNCRPMGRQELKVPAINSFRKIVYELEWSMCGKNSIAELVVFNFRDCTITTNCCMPILSTMVAVVSATVSNRYSDSYISESVSA